MGTEYRIQVRAGYDFDLFELVKPFEEVIPEESHTEPRWDSHTGKKVKPEKVIDRHERVVYSFDGTYEDEGECVESIANKAGCYFETYGDYVNGGPDRVVFFPKRPKLRERGNDTSVCNMDLDANIDYQSLVAQGPALERIGKKLKELGIKKVRKPEVVLIYHVS